MTRFLPLTACLLTLSLSACGTWGYKKGVGFTGINGEPASVAEANEEFGVVTRILSPMETLAVLPTANLRTDAASQADLATVAMDNGGATPQSAALVGMNSQELMLSMVRVNGQMFGVLKVPADNPGRMEEGAAEAFVASAPRLTGCLTQGNAYSKGGSNGRPKALAVPLNCS